MIQLLITAVPALLSISIVAGQEITNFCCTSYLGCARETPPIGPGPNTICVKNETCTIQPEGFPGRCFCDHGFYYDREESKCKPRSEECDVEAGFTYSTELETCVPLPVNVFDPCSRDSDCAGVGNGYTICYHYTERVGQCLCDPLTHFLGSGSLDCIALPRNVSEPCEYDENCGAVPNSECVDDAEGEETGAWGWCACLEGYEPVEGSAGCEAVASSTTVEATSTTEEPTTTEASTSTEPSTSMTEPETTTVELYTSTMNSSTTMEPISTTEPPPPPTTPEDAESTTSTPTTTTTSSTTTNATTMTPPPSTAECSAVDQFGTSWHAYGGQTARQLCPGRETGWVTWQCDQGGQFIGGQPNFGECVTEWVGALSGDIDDAISNGSLTLNKSAEFYGTIDGLIEEAIQSSLLNPGQNGANQFFGHEIAGILDLTGKLVTGVRDEAANVSDFEAGTARALEISGALVEFEKPWEQLSTTERADTFQRTVRFMEAAAFNLAGNVEGKVSDEDADGEGDSYSHSYGTSGSTYMLTVGIPDDEEGGVGFPLVSERRDDAGSSITLPGNWRDSVPGNGTNFVGLELSREFVRQNVESKVFNGREVDTDRGLNSKMLAFTIGGEGQQIDFGGEEVEVVHKLEQPAWGTERKRFKRRLHPGEEPSSVGATPNCSFFDPVKKVWSTAGCRLVSDGPYQTTCRCSHLSSFGLLSQSHEYAGKGLGQQITSIAAPVLPALGQVRHLYTAPPTLLRWREDFYKFLIIFFIVGNFAMTALIDRHYFHLPEGVCYAVGLVCHLFFLTCFMFLFVLTLDVYMTLDLDRVKVRPLLRRAIEKARVWRLTLYGLLGLVFPTVIVLITAITGLLVPNSRAYGGGFCWLDGGYIWAFYAPAVVIFVLNVAGILYFKAAITIPAPSGQSGAGDEGRAGSEGGASAESGTEPYPDLEARIMSANLLFSALLALTWFAAFYQTTPYLLDSPFLEFAFPLLNGAQGVALYLMYRSFTSNQAPIQRQQQRHRSESGEGGRSPAPGKASVLKSMAASVLKAQIGVDDEEEVNKGQGRPRQRNTGNAGARKQSDEENSDSEATRTATGTNSVKDSVKRYSGEGLGRLSAMMMSKVKGDGGDKGESFV